MLKLDFGSTVTQAQAMPSVAQPSFGTVAPSVRPMPVQTPIVSVAPYARDRLALGGVGLVFIAVATTGLIASFLTAQSSGRATKLKSDAAALESQLRTGAAGQALARLRTVEAQLSTFNGFLASATQWPELLDELAARTPSTVQLSNVAVDATGAVRIDGEGTSQQEVATFMAALDASEQFGQSVLASSALNESAEGSAVVFSLTTQLEAPSATTSAAAQPVSASVGTDADGGINAN